MTLQHPSGACQQLAAELLPCHGAGPDAACRTVPRHPSQGREGSHKFRKLIHLGNLSFRHLVFISFHTTFHKYKVTRASDHLYVDGQVSLALAAVDRKPQ